MAPGRLLWLDSDPAEAKRQALAALCTGAVVLCPTDTVYGLLAWVGLEAGYHSIYRLKQREQAKPLQLLIPADGALAQAAAALAAGEQDAQRGLQDGTATLVLPVGALPQLPALVQVLQPGPVGLRIPQHPFLQGLLAALPAPQLLWATSANASGEPPCNDAVMAQCWLEQAGDEVGLALLSSRPCAGTPSRVYRLLDSAWRRLR